MKHIFTLAALTLIAAGTTQGAIIVSEVHPNGSGGTNGYSADFFELTNTGNAAVDITGWKVDDNSNAFGSSVALRGLTSIAPGKSVVFVEGNTAGSNDASVQAAFIASWFGASTPVGFTIAGYGGSGIGLSTGGDAVNLFDSAGNRVTGVAFGAFIPATTFDNAVGIGGTSLPLPVISTGSVAGVNNAFLSGFGEIGSPGLTPEPTSLTLVAGACALARRRR